MQAPQPVARQPDSSDAASLAEALNRAARLSAENEASTVGASTATCCSAYCFLGVKGIGTAPHSACVSLSQLEHAIASTSA